MKRPVEHAKKLREMLSQVECGKKHWCAESGFQDLCKVKAMLGSRKYLVCLEAPGATCGFQVPHDNANLCYCPVRFYLHTEMGI